MTFQQEYKYLKTLFFFSKLLLDNFQADEKQYKYLIKSQLRQIQEDQSYMA